MVTSYLYKRPKYFDERWHCSYAKEI